MMEPGERETANVEIKEPRLKCPFNFNISPGPGPLSISVRSYFLYFYRRDESGYIIKPRTDFIYIQCEYLCGEMAFLFSKKEHLRIYCRKSRPRLLVV